MFRASRLRTLLVLIVLLPCAVAAAPAFDSAGKLRGDLPRVLDEASARELIPVSIVLVDQLEAADLRAKTAGLDEPVARRQAMVRALEEHAARTQAPLRARLEAAAAAGRAARIRPLWIGNIVAADLTADEIRAVAARPEVSHVNWAPPRAVFLDPAMSATPPRVPLAERLLAPFTPAAIDAEVECGVELMRAPEVWDDLGNTGEGSVIAVIDSGVCWYHSDIENQIWVNPGEDLDGDGVVMDDDDRNGIDDDGNGYIDDLIGYDIDNGDDDPNDDNSHGSHCAGTVAGDGTGGFQAGMAPDAEIMVLRVGLATSDEPDVWEAMQYAAENGADAITMSLGWKHSWDPDRETWRNNCENTIEMGTAMVIAAGNEGSGNEPDNVRTPGDVPRVITVGAVNCSDQAAGFSSRGPVTWEDVPPWNDHPYPPGLIKPDVAGPGVDTRSHNKCSGYSYKSGTSMATPHVAGAVALMLSANPGLTHDDLKLLLEDTAVELGEPGKDNVYGSGRVDAYEAVLQSATPDGKISIKETNVSCSDMLHITVSDLDLEGAGTIDVEVWSGTETDPEIVTLEETSPASAVFKGEIATTPGVPAPDGQLQVGHEDVITALYIDEDDGQGGTNVEKTDTATADCREPLISDVRTTDISTDRATVRWTTDESSTSDVVYGPLVPPDLRESSGGLVIDHAVTLTGLAECTVYYYQVESGDRLDNLAVDDNGGAYYRFETYGEFPDIGIVPCHDGQVSLDTDIYACTDRVEIAVTDLDLNTDDTVVETAQVLATTTVEPDGEWVVVTEESANSARFTGGVDLASGPAIAGDGLLQAGDAGHVTVSYFDADDGSGAGGWDAASATTDCLVPAVEGVRVTWLGNTRAVIEWDTDEPATSRVDFGPTPELGEVEEDPELVTAHRLDITGFTACEEVFFTVSGTDAYGNHVTIDAAGAPFRFDAREIPGLYFYDDFESEQGWILRDTWALGEPQGQGGARGNPDPDRAFGGDQVLGHNLAGDYGPNLKTHATSPYIECGECVNSELIFHRHLNVEGANDSARVEIIANGRSIIWENGDQTVTDSDWGEQRYDISEEMDGLPAAQLRFVQVSDGSMQYSGWNIDEVIIKDGTLPDYQACGDCGGAPTFRGLGSVTDPDACAPGGLTLSWEEAAAWGTGGAGSYAVYRSEDPAFEPGPATLVASGIGATSWTDADAPVDRDLYYVVRAENDEACAAGPANGGMMDDNLARLLARETTTRPPAGSPEDSVRVDDVGHVHLRLSWREAAATSFYRVYESSRPDMSDATVLAETPEPFAEDEDELTRGGNVFYRVVAVNPCGAETP